MAPASTTIDPPMRPSLDDEAIGELKRLVKGTVHTQADSGFVRHSQLFNAAIRSAAQLLVRPLDTRDVSEVVKFCTKHNLTLSAKSGGYGTHGWAVEGDVIIDMRLIAQITIERPGEGGEPDALDWTSLRDAPHVAVQDPDTLKGKGRMPSASAYPNAYPSGVGPPPIHAPFTDPRRRSADEAFSSSPVVVVPPSSSSPAPDGDRMLVDGEDNDKDAARSTSGSGSGSERPSRRLRVSSPMSGRGSHSNSNTSTTSTPPTTGSPHTPADEQKSAPADAPSPPSQAKNGKIKGPVTSDEVQHDEGMIPPAADRPGVGVDVRGYVGRDVGGWNTVWNGESTRGIAAESVGVSYVMGGPASGMSARMDGMGAQMNGMSTRMDGMDGAPGGMSAMMGASSWLWAPPPTALGPPPSTPNLSASPAPMSTRSPPRSNGPPNARPFDFSDSSATLSGDVNAFINPHATARPPTPGVSSLPARPFDFGPPSNERGSTPASPPPAASSSSIPLPTVTHVPFVPSAPVAHTYVTFGAGASQKDVDAFCAAHPLAAVVARSNPSLTTDRVDEEDNGPSVVADSARPELYERPTGTGFGPGSGSFFAPGTVSSSPQIPYFVPFAAHPVGSSVMILGGFGFLSRLHGLSMDCLVEAEVVLPDGRIVWVSKEGVRGEDGVLWEEEDDGEGWGVDEDGDVLDDPANKENGDQSKAQLVDGVGSIEKQKQKMKEGRTPPDTPPPDEEDKEDKPKVKRGLWWALRGAGSAFGVVVRYKAKAFPVPVVFAGNLIYNFNKLTAASLIKHFRDCIKAAPRELYANCILTAGPKGKGALVVIQICYAGPRAEGLPFLQAISSWEGDSCLLNEVQEKEFVWQQDSVAKVLKGGSGRKWFIRSDLISSLTDEIIHRTVRKFGDTPDGCTWLFELSGGALTDTHDSCLPKVAREAAFTIVALHQWKLEENDPACVLTAEEWIKEALAPQSTGGPFPCFLERREKRSRILGVYGRDNWVRLCALKKRYDPNGMFRHNFWPLDEAGMPVVDPKLMKEDKTGLHAVDSTLDDRGVPVPT